MLNFTEKFYAPPVVMVTINHLYDSKNVYSVKPENNVLNTWIEVSYNHSRQVDFSVYLVQEKNLKNHSHMNLQPLNYIYAPLPGS